MIVSTKHIPAIMRKYGFINGLKIYLQLKFTTEVELPGIPRSIKFRKSTSDIDSLYQVFIQKEYDGIKLPNARYIIDGGANIGMFTIKMKSLFPNASVLCIEPDADNFKQLKKNLSGYNNVTAIEAGLWYKNTQLRLNETSHGKWGMMVSENVNGSVPAITIDNLLHDYDFPYVDILKLDIESSEKYLFKPEFISWLPRVRTIVIELHDFMEAGCGMAFLKSVVKYYANFSYAISGENTIIINKDFKIPDEG